MENLAPNRDPQGSPDLKLASYDYHLPTDRIAHNPVIPRDSSRLLVVGSADPAGKMGNSTYTHCRFSDLPQFLRSGDLLVLNDTRVMPARLYGRKPEGAAVEVLLLEEQESHCWLALVKPGKRLKPGAEIEFGDSLSSVQLRATVIANDRATGGRILQFHLPPNQSLQVLLEELGQVPLPPYITDSQAEPDQYQTVYAKQLGAVAAPTAGLHFTDELLERLRSQGIEQSLITLHVGVGTFRPVDTDDITSHAMHGEWLQVSPETVAKIQQTKANGGRVIAVGTTVVRALETAAQGGELHPFSGKTNLFIYPGYCWQVVDGLITNFHLPRSSLLMLVSALIGRPRLLALYQAAIAAPAGEFGQPYRFYSFGDAMFIPPEATGF